MSRDLEGRVALVMGAGSSGPGIGNGRATAVLFARAGATVVCADLSVESAQETVDLIVAEGGEGRAVGVDVTSEAQIEALVADVRERHGRIDVLDNNVGIGPIGGVVETDEQTWDLALAVNLKSAAFAMRHTIPVMKQQGGGSIVNISSVASIKWSGVPYAAYYATKAALNHLSRTTAAEFARDRIRVNCVLPGLIKTPMVAGNAALAAAYDAADLDKMWAERDRMVPLGHMGTAWDVAEAALFLAGDRARYITGIDLVVDGGIALGFAD